MASINWNEYELVLEDTSSKECEVTGRETGATEINTCPVSALLGNGQPHWSGSYGGYGSVRVSFISADDEGLHLNIYNGYDFPYTLKLGETWSSGWYSFGSWDYLVKLYIRKIGEK